MSPRVALVCGFWGQNMGNAFFNLGGKWLLDEAFGSANVSFIQDQPGLRTFHDQSKGNPRHAFDVIANADIDLLVMQGPLLTTTAAALHSPTMEALSKRGARWLYLSAALFEYSPAEIAAAREFVSAHPPIAISTRDRQTADALQGLGVPIHCGIDSAFALPEAVRPFTMLPDRPYVAVTFNRYPEPTFVESDTGVPVGNTRYVVRQPRIPMWASGKGKWQAYIGAVADRRHLPDELGGLPIVRLDHRTNPYVGWKAFRRPNSVAADDPWTYASLYASASLVLSDRVHACVAGLAYGRPAMLFTPSPRTALFDHLEIGDPRRGPVELGTERRLQELGGIVDFLRRFAP